MRRLFVMKNRLLQRVRRIANPLKGVIISSYNNSHCPLPKSTFTNSTTLTFKLKKALMEHRLSKTKATKQMKLMLVVDQKKRSRWSKRWMKCNWGKITIYSSKAPSHNTSSLLWPIMVKFKTNMESRRTNITNNLKSFWTMKN